MTLPTWLIALLAACGLTPFAAAGVVWKLVLPWLRDQIAEPAQQAAHAVTVNHHSSESPTVLDKLEDLKQAVKAVDTKVGSLDDKLDGHLIAASGIDAGVKARLDGHDRELGQINRQIFRRPDDN